MLVMALWHNGVCKRSWIDPYQLNTEDDSGHNIVLNMLDRFIMHLNVLLIGENKQTMKD